MIFRKDSAFISHILDNIDVSLVVSDPHQADHPMIYVNRHFLKLTGYALADCIGMNCRFLQGKETDANAVQRVRDSINKRQFARIEILNYRKDGASFWNELNLFPVLDPAGTPLHFVAMQFPADKKRQHKKKILKELISIMDL